MGVYKFHDEVRENSRREEYVCVCVCGEGVTKNDFNYIFLCFCFLISIKEGRGNVCGLKEK